MKSIILTYSPFMLHMSTTVLPISPPFFLFINPVPSNPSHHFCFSIKPLNNNQQSINTGGPQSLNTSEIPPSTLMKTHQLSTRHFRHNHQASLQHLLRTSCAPEALRRLSRRSDVRVFASVRGEWWISSPRSQRRRFVRRAAFASETAN